MTTPITPAAEAIRDAYRAADRVTYEDRRDYPDALWQTTLEELEANGWVMRRIGVECHVCRARVVMADTSAIRLDDGSTAYLCHECQKAARE